MPAKARCRENMLPAGSRYIGKQTWQAHQEMASGKFLRLGFEPGLVAGSRPGKRRLTARAGDTFVANVTTTVYTSSADFGGLETSGAAHRPAPALAGGESRSHEASAEAYIPANDSRAHAVREAGRPRDGRVIGHWTSDRKSLPQRRREGGDIGPEPSSSPGGDPEPANVRRCAADSRRCVEGDGRPTVRPRNGTKARADRRAREQRGHLD